MSVFESVFFCQANILEQKEPPTFVLLGEILIDNLVTGRFVGKTTTGLVYQETVFALYPLSVTK